MAKESKGSKRAVWLIALGALAGILFAPASGRETRRAIVTEIRDGGRYLVSLGHDTQKELDHISRKVPHL